MLKWTEVNGTEIKLKMKYLINNLKNGYYCPGKRYESSYPPSQPQTEKVDIKILQFVAKTEPKGKKCDKKNVCLWITLYQVRGYIKENNKGKQLV